MNMACLGQHIQHFLQCAHDHLVRQRQRGYHVVTPWIHVLCRPLVLGRRPSPMGDEYCIASEDCAFGPIGFERVRDVNPGEMVIITRHFSEHPRASS